MLIEKEDAKKAICNVCYMFKYIGDEYKECKYYPCDDIKALEAIPSAEAEQVTGKLDSPCGSSVTGDSEERKEQKSKLESADATCATCADRAMCIMSAPDGKWKACKDYRPSAEAVQGEWIKTADGNSWNEWGVLTCPLCGASIEDKYYHSWKYNFCPNCGAKMKGGDDE